MCGIVGMIGKNPVADQICDSLRRLEYRGYDSAGIATLVNGVIHKRRAEGKLVNLQKALYGNPLEGNIGIGHIRWATHGAPTENNAHPHATDKVAIVHNGIIENFRDLQHELEAKNHVFTTETDSEVIAHLITEFLNQGENPKNAVYKTLQRLEGAFALAIIFAGNEQLMYGARKGSPLAIGLGDDEMYLGSDAMALAPFTNKILYLEDEDWCELTPTTHTIYNLANQQVQRDMRIVNVSNVLAEKGEHRHFMSKEIYEQPTVVSQTLSTYLDHVHNTIRLPNLPINLENIQSLAITACGTAYYAGFVAKYWLEQLVQIPVEIDVASEYRYRQPPIPKDFALVVISQSGETADTLAALRYVQQKNSPVLGIVNVAESTIMRECDVWLPIHAGPEIGVASTKAFTCQLTALACLTLAFAEAKKTLNHEQMTHYIKLLNELPRHMNKALSCSAEVEAISHDLCKTSDVLFLGRGAYYPLAMEGSLKLKEISYIHAEGYAAGEMKHGPIALIDENMPVVVIAPSNHLYEKTISNMQEVIARGGKVILISDKKGIAAAGNKIWKTIEMPEVDDFIAPIVYSVPVQLLAYHTAVSKGTDVDQPRNLAKSVTVE